MKSYIKYFRNSILTNNLKLGFTFFIFLNILYIHYILIHICFQIHKLYRIVSQELAGIYMLQY